MKNDKILSGLIAGIMGAIVQTIVTYLLHQMHLSNIHYLQLAGDLFLHAEDAKGFSGFLVGLFADLTIGSIWGIIFAIMYPYLKMDNAWLIKSIGFGLFLWVVGIGLLERTLHIYPPLERSPSANLSLLLGSVLYALIASWCLKRTMIKT